MQTLLVDLILAAAVGAVFLIALRGRKIGWGKGSPDSGSLAKFFNLLRPQGNFVDVTTTIEFVYYLLCIGILIAALHLDVGPWAEQVALIGWAILIAVPIWFIGWDLPTQRGWQHDWSE
jgi:hypothetical protein